MRSVKDVVLRGRGAEVESQSALSRETEIVLYHFFSETRPLFSGVPLWVGYGDSVNILEPVQ